MPSSAAAFRRRREQGSETPFNDTDFLRLVPEFNRQMAPLLLPCCFGRTGQQIWMSITVESADPNPISPVANSPALAVVSGVQRFWMEKGSPQLPKIERADGLYLWDESGRRYIDASSGPVACNLGHSHRHVIEAMRQQAERVSYAFPTNFESQAAADLTANLASLTGPGLEHGLFVSGGSEAVEMSIKFARVHALATGNERKTTVLARTPSYHGNTFGALAVSGEAYVEPVYADMLRMMPKIPLPSAYRPPAGMTPDEYAHSCIKAFEREVVEQGPESVLAFIMEPVTGLSGGASYAPDFYYRGIREICSNYDILLIYDEVMSGSGRTGKFLAAHHWPDARPDIVALAKGLGAGYFPLGALVTGSHLLEPVVANGGFRMGHTGMSSPLSCAVANAVLEVLINEDLMDNAEQMGAYYRQRLVEIQQTSRILGDVRGMGLLNAVELVSDKDSRAFLPPEVAINSRIVAAAMARGLLIYARPSAGGGYGDWLMMTPPLNVTRAQIDEIADLFADSLSEVESKLAEEGAIV